MEDNNNRREKRRRQSSFDYDKVSREWNADIASERPQKKEKDSYNGKEEECNTVQPSPEATPPPPLLSPKGSGTNAKSIIKKILFIPLCLLALFGLLVIIGIIVDYYEDNSEKENSYTCVADTIVAHDECVDTIVCIDTVEYDLQDTPTEEIQMPKPETNYSEIVANYKSKAKKLNSIWVKAEELFALKEEFESLPEEARKKMPKEEKQLYYYNMFFTATSPKDIESLKEYAKSYFTAEQVWMLKRSYLYNPKRFYEVYKREGMSFSGARKVYLEKGWK